MLCRPDGFACAERPPPTSRLRSIVVEKDRNLAYISAYSRRLEMGVHCEAKIGFILYYYLAFRERCRAVPVRLSGAILVGKKANR